MIDRLGLYVETDGDGGDCPHRTGTMIGYKALIAQDPNTTIQAVLKNLSPAPNVYFRYPTVYNQPSDFSRDQASRLMLGLGIAKRKDLVKGYYKLLLKNGLKHPNGDYLGIGEINNLIRSLAPWYLSPLAWLALLVMDCKFLGDLYFRNHTVTISGIKISIKKSPVWGYDALICEDMYWSKKRLWTPTGWLARKLYKKTDANQQIWHNLIDPTENGCVEAGQALQDILSKM